MSSIDGPPKNGPSPSRASVSREARRLVLCVGIACAFVSFASARIVATHKIFSATWDEPLHIAAGLELLSHRTYTHDLQNAPLARVAAAVGPYLAGAQSAGLPGAVAEGNAVILSGPGYRRNLELARLGVLPFFIAACALLYAWARVVAGDQVAAIATAIFTLTPPVLGHAGLATTDVAGAAGFVAILLTFTLWLARPRSLSRSAWFGLAVGLGVAAKLSLISFFAASTAAMGFSRWLYSRRMQNRAEISPTGQRSVRELMLAGSVALVALFGAYGFSLDNGAGAAIPLKAFWLGIQSLVGHNLDGNVSYLLGETYLGGRWAFFPIALAVKTPLPIVGLALGGSAMAWQRWWRGEGITWLDPVIATLVPLVVASGANLNLGVRHILPIYPAVAFLAALGLVTLWRVGITSRAIAIALGLWLIWKTSRVHPDYLAYFNETASRDPGAVLVDSDLDWGQDLERLGDIVRARGVTKLSLAYFGTTNRAEQLMPRVQRVGVGDPRPTGWFAVSETYYRRGLEAYDANGKRMLYPDAFAWLRAYQPVAWAGRSIRLYKLPDTNGVNTPPLGARK